MVVGSSGSELRYTLLPPFWKDGSGVEWGEDGVLKVLDSLYVTCGGACRKYWLFIKGFKCPPRFGSLLCMRNHNDSCVAGAAGANMGV